MPLNSDYEMTEKKFDSPLFKLIPPPVSPHHCEILKQREFKLTQKLGIRSQGDHTLLSTHENWWFKSAALLMNRI